LVLGWNKNNLTDKTNNAGVKQKSKEEELNNIKQRYNVAPGVDLSPR